MEEFMRGCGKIFKANSIPIEFYCIGGNSLVFL